MDHSVAEIKQALYYIMSTRCPYSDWTPNDIDICYHNYKTYGDFENSLEEYFKKKD